MFRKLITTRERRRQSPEIAQGAAKHREDLAKVTSLSFHLSIFGPLLSILVPYLVLNDQSRKSIMPRVEFWAGGGACPQGYPVPAFRFTRELDRAKMSGMRPVQDS